MSPSFYGTPGKATPIITTVVNSRKHGQNLRLNDDIYEDDDKQIKYNKFLLRYLPENMISCIEYLIDVRMSHMVA